MIVAENYSKVVEADSMLSEDHHCVGSAQFSKVKRLLFKKVMYDMSVSKVAGEHIEDDKWPRVNHHALMEFSSKVFIVMHCRRQYLS